MNKYINPNFPVYISYAQRNASYPDIEVKLGLLCRMMEENNVLYILDKGKAEKCLMPYHRRVMEAEEEIGRGRVVIAVLGYKYLHSIDCLYELHCILARKDYAQGLFPILLPDFPRLRDNAVMKDLAVFLKEKHKGLSRKKGLTDVEQAFVDGNGFLDEDGDPADLIELNRFLRNYIRNFDKDDCQAVLEQIVELVLKLESDFSGMDSVDKVCFKFEYMHNLVSRDDDVDALMRLMENNRVVNLYGFGGSGKTSLINLFVMKYGNLYGQIAGIVVNYGIIDDFVSQLNSIIKINGIENLQKADRYRLVVDYLEKNCHSSKPNLFIIDINKTIDDEIRDFVELLCNNSLLSNKIFPDGWNYVIISRENIYRGASSMNINLHDTDNEEFLRELFVAKAGPKYKTFPDFGALFEFLSYNALLVDQLAMYLSDIPVRNYGQIKDILNRNSFRKQKIVGISAYNRVSGSEEEKTILGFLKNLVNFKDLRSDEQKLLVFFAVWPVDYIPLNVISGLLKGIFDSLGDLEYALFLLVKRSMLSVKDDGDSCQYRLHGIMAKSIREQIDFKSIDCSQYFNNIREIVLRDYWYMLPYENCIVSSLCGFLDAPDDLLFDVAFRFHKGYLTQCSLTMYLRVVKIREQKVRDYPENEIYKVDLARVYCYLADMYYIKLHDIESAWDYCGKTKSVLDLCGDVADVNNIYLNVLNIEALLNKNHKGDKVRTEECFRMAIGAGLREQNPSDEHNHDLARVINNFAYFLDTMTDKYELAKSYYETGIAIGKKLPADDPDYQNNLAGLYSNFGNFQGDKLKDYESAKSNLLKAIGIREKLESKGPFYQNYLAVVYIKLARLYEECLGDSGKAEFLLRKADRIKNTNLWSSNIIFRKFFALSYNLMANIQKGRGDMDMAVENYTKAIEIAESLPQTNAEFSGDLETYRRNLASIPRTCP